MIVVEPGINKALDRIAKELVDESFDLFLRMLGFAGPDSVIDLRRQRPESAPPIVMPDYVATLRIDGGDPCLFHVEFYDRDRKEIPEKMARYGGSLAWQYRLPVKSVALLLSSTGCPDEVPEVGVHRIGVTSISHQFQTVKLWELDPAPVLAYADQGLLPWAVLMRLGREEAWNIGAKVAQRDEQRAISRFLILSSVRYDRTEVDQMLGGTTVTLEEAIVEGSSLVHERVARSKAEGKAEQTRHLLRRMLAEDHPGLDVPDELDWIVDNDKLEALLMDYMRCRNGESLVRAIREAAN